MSEIPNGPATIEILSDKDGVIGFRFVSFPELLRGNSKFTGAIQLSEQSIKYKQWRINSQIDPEIQYLQVYCPGRLSARDDRILVWKDGRKNLDGIIGAINKKYHIEGRRLRGSWAGLKTRVDMYRSSIGSGKG